jgi:hypothetical protein
MSIEIEKITAVSISAAEFVQLMKIYDVAEFACAVAERFDKDFANRADVADAFAGSLSEQGVRFLAEIVTSFYGRKRHP